MSTSVTHALNDVSHRACFIVHYPYSAQRAAPRLQRGTVTGPRLSFISSQSEFTFSVYFKNISVQVGILRDLHMHFNQYHTSAN